MREKFKNIKIRISNNVAKSIITSLKIYISCPLQEQTNEELEGTEACHKNDINCSSEETKIKTSKVKGPSQPVAADEPKSYLPIYILQRP